MNFLVGGCLGGFLKDILPSVLQITYLSKFRGLVSYGEYTYKICSAADLIRNCRGILKKAGKALVCGVESISVKKVLVVETGSVNGSWRGIILQYSQCSSLLGPGEISGNSPRRCPGALFPTKSGWHCCYLRSRSVLAGHGVTYEQLSESAWALQGHLCEEFHCHLERHS